MMDDAEKQLDIPSEPSFMTFYESLSSASPLTFRFFERTDYYTIHGDNAHYVANSFLSTKTVIKYIGTSDRKIASVALSQNRFESLVRHLLLVKHYRVEIYKSKKANKNWYCDCKCSPGNLGPLDEIVFNSNESIESRGLMSLRCFNNCLGIAFVDVISGVMSLCQFQDNEYYSHLECLLLQLSPNECLLIKDNVDNDMTKKLKKIFERNNILITECKKSFFNDTDLVNDVIKLVKKKGLSDSAITAIIDNKEHASSALSACIKYLDLISDDSNCEKFELSEFELKQFMRLDANAVHAFEIFPNPSDGIQSAKSNRTLFSVLNKCRTISGQRLLAQWIRQPLRDVQKIEERLDIVEYFIDNTDIRQQLHENYLRRIPDLSRLCRKFYNKGKANLQDCYRIYLVIKIVPELEKLFSDSPNDAINANFSENLKDLKTELYKYKEMIEKVIDLKRVEQNEFWINPDFDESLNALNEDIVVIENSSKVIQKRVAKMTGLDIDKAIKIETNPQGFMFKVTRKNETEIRNKENHFTIEQTKKDGVRFTNKDLKQLSLQYQEARADYERQQKSIVEETVFVASGYCEYIRKLESILSFIDVTVSLSCAAIASSLTYTRPKLLPQGSGRIELKRVRHPCLELQENASFIPNDITLNPEQFKQYIITGPNMGGKSTFIRSVGICVLMAQIGSFVPAESAVISIVDGIYTRVGAGDKQIKGISTFMAEMVETAAIFRTATIDSLIVIDELGRGTSTFDGFGLAWSILEHIANVLKSYTLFATHFHELTDLSKEIPSIRNVHLKAITTSDRLAMLYEVIDGICDQSFGIHVAELAKFPLHIIEDAKVKLSELEGSNDLNVDLNNENLINSVVEEILKLPKDVDSTHVRSLILKKLSKT